MKLAVVSVLLLFGTTLATPNSDQDHQLIIEDFPAHSHDQPGEAFHTELSIYEYLSEQPRYSKLVRLLDWESDYISVLNDTSKSITFFAPDNKALTPPKKKKEHRPFTLESISAWYEELYAINGGDGDGEDDEEKKKFKKILHALLEYHTFPTGLNKHALYLNATYPTSLWAGDGSYDGQPRRVAIKSSLIGLVANFYALLEHHYVETPNGFLYGINHPLFPLPSIFDQLFLVDRFSVLTSALQKVGLDSEVQWRLKANSETEGNAPVVSFFAPTNTAWKHLPPRLRLWLFSPAGEKALKKLLQFHIVPKWILHADWQYDATGSEERVQTMMRVPHHCHGFDEPDKELAYIIPVPEVINAVVGDTLGNMWSGLTTSVVDLWDAMFRSEAPQQSDALKCRVKNKREMARNYPRTTGWPHPKPPLVTVNITVPTLLDEHNIKFVVMKPDTSSDVMETAEEHWAWWRSITVVNGQYTEIEDTARNGALYQIGQVLHPFKAPDEATPGSYQGLWEDWEDWLPAWGDE